MIASASSALEPVAKQRMISVPAYARPGLSKLSRVTGAGQRDEPRYYRHMACPEAEVLVAMASGDLPLERRACGAFGEASAATGVDGDQAGDLAMASGAVYMFQ